MKVEYNTGGRGYIKTQHLRRHRVIYTYKANKRKVVYPIGMRVWVNVGESEVFVS